jgi:hypothetical protein
MRVGEVRILQFRAARICFRDGCKDELKQLGVQLGSTQIHHGAAAELSKDVVQLLGVILGGQVR